MVTVTVQNAGPTAPAGSPVWQQAWFWIVVVVVAGGGVLGYRYLWKKPRGKEPEE